MQDRKPHAQLGNVSDEMYTKFSGVTDTVVVIKTKGPLRPSMIDLPGYRVQMAPDQVALLKNIMLAYMERENTMILFVVACGGTLLQYAALSNKRLFYDMTMQ